VPFLSSASHVGSRLLNCVFDSLDRTASNECAVEPLCEFVPMWCRNRLRCFPYVDRLSCLAIQTICHHLHRPLFTGPSRHDKTIAELVESFVHRPTSPSKGPPDRVSELGALGCVVISFWRPTLGAVRLFQGFSHCVNNVYFFLRAVDKAAATACFCGCPDLTISRMFSLTTFLLVPFFSGIVVSLNVIVHKQDRNRLVIVLVWVAPQPVDHDFVLFLDGFSYLTAPFMVGVSWLWPLPCGGFLAMPGLNLCALSADIRCLRGSC